MIDLTGLNKTASELTGTTQPKISQQEKERLEKEATEAKYGKDPEESKADTMAENAQSKLARGGFTTVSEVLIQLDLLATAKSASNNQKIDAMKEKIEQSKNFSQQA